MATLQKITTNLWFDREAEEAAEFYTSIFKNSRIGNVSRYSEAGQEHHHMPPGTAMTVEFWLGDHSFLGLNGGPVFKFNEAVSLIINCEDQEEVDYFWNRLTEGGDPNAQVCGWLKDKYGLSWQVVPTIVSKLMSDPDKEKSGRAMQAIMQMKKLDVQKLQDAFDGK